MSPAMITTVFLLLQLMYSTGVQNSPILIQQPEDWLTFAGIPENDFQEELATGGGRKHANWTAYLECNARGSGPVTYAWYFVQLRPDRTALTMEITGDLAQQKHFWRRGHKVEGNALLINLRRLPRRVDTLSWMENGTKYFCVASNKYGSVRSRTAQLIHNSLSVRDISFTLESPAKLYSLVWPMKEDVVSVKHSQQNLNYVWFRQESDSAKRMPLSRTSNIALLGPALLFFHYDESKDFRLSVKVSWSPWYQKDRPLSFYSKTFTSTARLSKFTNNWDFPVYIIEVRKDPGRRPLVAGEHYELHCLVGSTKPVEIGWLKQYKPITTGSQPRFRIENNCRSLIFDPVSTSDSAVYTCSVNVDGYTYNTTNHEVKVVPRLELVNPEPQALETVTGLSISLNCSYRSGGYLRPAMWYHNNVRLRTRNTTRYQFFYSTGLARLILLHPTPRRDRGTYQCLFNRYVDDTSSKNSSLSTKRLTSSVSPSDYVDASWNDYDEHIGKMFQVRVTEYNNRHPEVTLTPSGPDYLVHPDQKASVLVIEAYDKDVGDSGRVECDLHSCEVTPCPFAVVPMASLQKGHVVYYALKLVDRSLYDSPSSSSLQDRNIDITVLCKDKAEFPRIKWTSFFVNISSKAEIKYSLSEDLLTLLSATIDSSTSDKLANITSMMVNFTSVEINLASYTLASLVDKEDIVGEKSDVILRTFDNIMEANLTMLQLSESSTGAATNYFNSLLRFGTTLLKVNSSYALSSGLVSVAGLNKKNWQVVSRDDSVVFQLDSANTAQLYSTSSSNLEKSPGEIVAIGVRKEAVLGDSILFHHLGNDRMMSVQTDSRSKIVSPVLAAQTTLVSVPSASVDDYFPVSVLFRLTAEYGPGDLSCVFWDMATKNWSAEGCLTIFHNTRTTLCNCTHLTNFALLLQVDCSTTVAAHHSFILKILTYVGLTISSVALFVAIIIFVLFLKSRNALHSGAVQHVDKSTPMKIIISFSLALLLGNLVFLAGGNYPRNDIGCTIIGVLLHYFYLCVFTWSLVEDFQIFLAVIYLAFRQDQFTTYVSKFFLKASMFAWGVPLVIVATTLGVNQGANYGVQSCSEGPKLCFLRQFPFYIAFLTPAALIVLIDAVVFGLIIYVIFVQNRKSMATSDGSKKQESSQRQALVGVVGLVFLLCITWISGMLQISKAKVVFQYVFVISTTLQGAFVFVFYCLLRRDVHRFTMKTCLGRKSGRKMSISSSSAAGAHLINRGNARSGNTGATSSTGAGSTARVTVKFSAQSSNEDVKNELHKHISGEGLCQLEKANEIVQTVA